MTNHCKFMKLALSLAARGLGRTGENPSVGCVIVKGGAVIGRGVTAVGGRPHAEIVALMQAGKTAKGADMYVSLEPCCHFGKSPPCTDAIIKSGIGRVIISNIDPFPEVGGKGIKKLRTTGIEVITGVLEPEGEEVNAGFFKRILENRPYVTLKIAASLDGKTALEDGESKWITGIDARNFGHLLRSQSDAIMTGIGTVLADDPMLDCRLPGLEDRSPLRVIIDSKLRISKKSKIIATAKKIPTVVFTAAPSGKALLKSCVTIEKIKSSRAGLDLRAALGNLAGKGINRILVESGGKLAASLLKENLVDEIYWFVAPKIIGGEGLNGIAELGIRKMENVKNFALAETKKLGDDLVLRLKRS